MFRVCERRFLCRLKEVHRRRVCRNLLPFKLQPETISVVSFTTQEVAEKSKSDGIKRPGIYYGIGAACSLTAVSFLIADTAGEIFFHGSANPVSGVPVAILAGVVTNYLLNSKKVQLPVANKQNETPIMEKLAPGLKFCTTTILRAGIICVGVRLSAYDIVQLGSSGLPVVVTCVGSGLIVIPWLSEKMYVIFSHRWLVLSDSCNTF